MTKQIRLSIRLDEELFDLINSILPLFNSRTEAIEFILKDWQDGESHTACLEKIGNMKGYMLRLEAKFNSKKD